MNLPLSLHPDAVREMGSAHDWYEDQQAGLGTRFLSEVEKVFDKIVANPLRYAFADGDVREVLVHRFPFVVFYRVLTDRIRVVAVFHTARNPARWQSRT